jgi:hypothetical protein
MDYSEIGGTSQPDGGMPVTPVGSDEEIRDVKITNTGQRIRAIAVLLLALAAAAGYFYWSSQKQAEIEQYERARADFQKAHAKGYTSFWADAQVDVKEMKTNEDFALRMKQIISEQAVGYANHLKESSIPILDKALPDYKAISVPSVYVEKTNALTKSYEALRESWNVFSDELLRLDKFYPAKKKLEKVSSAWLGAQQSGDEKYTKDAYTYYVLMECVLPGKNLGEIELADINNAIRDSCMNNRSQWFARVAFDCMPKLLESPGDPNEAFTALLEKAKKAEKVDFSSKFGIEDCLKECRPKFDDEIIEKLALAWANYVKSQNDFLAAMDAKLKEIR